MARILNFFKGKINLTFTILGVLILMSLVGSLVWGVNFALRSVNNVFESEAASSTMLTHFDLKGFEDFSGIGTSTPR